MDAGGLFPTWGSKTAFMAVLFKYGVPSLQLRSMGRYKKKSSFSLIVYNYYNHLATPHRRIGALIAYTVFWMFGTNFLPYYWYQLQASPDAFGDIMVSDYFDLQFFSSHWKRPGFRRYVV